MVKKISIILFIFFLSLVHNAHTAPCYGTKMPQKSEYFGGFQTHVIFEEKLENGFGTIRSRQHFFQISYGVYDWLSIDLKGGAGNIKQHPVGSDEIDYPSSFAGGYGFRIKFYDQDKIKAVFGFQHISVHPRSTRLNGERNMAILDDWQVSLLASYDFLKFTPYLGAKFSRVDYIHWVAGNRKRRMSDLTKTLGLVFGLDLTLTEKTWLNLEGQLIDGEAAALSFNFKF